MTTAQEVAAITVAQRQHWMQILARAGQQLHPFAQALRQQPYQCIRPAEIGMVMVRGRTGGSGAPFNLGEMTVTRCVIQLDHGQHGHSYVAGRDKEHAELAALADAHLQSSQHRHWMDALITPLAQRQNAERASRDAASAATQVEFVTLVRGED
ncbi:phosphonate C-P lyase system protein PhnG [Alcaligenaceae bacterium]|nr:phosphonate C-P lyase system protein PhnG [Alcaligenaceae bacterium]